MEIENNSSTGSGHFEAKENERRAGKMTYKKEGENTIIIDHTEVDPQYQGKGIGKQMVDKAAEYARENNLKIKAQCSYAKKVMERSSDYDDVLI